MLVVVIRFISAVVLFTCFIFFYPAQVHAATLTTAYMSQNDFDVKLLAIVRSVSLHDYDKALKLIAELSGKDLSPAQQDKLRALAAECYVDKGHFDDAAAVVGELNRSENPYFRAYAEYISGRIAYAKQDYTEAMRKFRSAIDISANDNNFYIWLGQANLAQAKIVIDDKNSSEQARADALKRFKPVMEEVKDYLIKNNYLSQAYELSYVAYAQVGMEPEAMDNLINYVTYSPPSIDAIKELYQVFYMRKDFLSDIAMLDALNDPKSEFSKRSEFLYMQGKSMIAYGLTIMDSVLADIELSDIEGVNGQYDREYYMSWINEGMDKYARIKAKKDISPQMSKQLMLEEISVYMATRQLDKAIKLVHENKGMSSDIPEMYRIFGMISFYAGEYKQGLKYMDKAISLAQKNNDVISLSYSYDSLSAYYGYHGEYQLAKEYSDKAVTLDNEDDMLRLMYNRYFSLKKLKDHKAEAERLRNDIISKYARAKTLSRDEQAMLLLMFSDESIEKNDIDKGIEYAKYAQNLSPTVADSYYYVALCLYKKKDYKTALKWVKRAQYYEEADPQYIYLEELIHKGNGNNKAAAVAAKRVKDKAPKFIESL